VPRISHDKPGVTYACPACDSTCIYQRTGNGNTSDHPERPYRCENCSVVLTYIIARPKKNGKELQKQRTLGYENGPRQRTARELEAINPEDVGLSPIGVRGGAAD